MSAEEDRAEYDENELSFDVDDIDLDLEYQDNDSDGDDRNERDPDDEKASDDKPIDRKSLGQSRSGNSRNSDRGVLYTRGAFRKKNSTDKTRVMQEESKDLRRDLWRVSYFSRKWDQGPKRIECDLKSRLDMSRRIKDFRTELDASRSKGEVMKDIQSKSSGTRRWDIQPSSKEADLKSRERRSRSRDKRSRSRDRRSRSRDKSSRSGDKRPRSRDKRSQSRDKRSRSKDNGSRSKDETSRSRDNRPQSMDKRSRSRDKSSRSLDIISESRDDTSKSGDKTSHNQDKTGSRDKPFQSRDISSRSKDKRSRSRDKRSRSRDKRSRSRDRRSHSKDKRSRSRDKRSRSRGIRSHSMDKQSRSLQKVSSSKMDELSRDRNHGGDIQSKISRSKGVRSKSREKRSNSRKRRSISREKKSDSQVRRSRSREASLKTRENDLRSGEGSKSKDIRSKSRDRRSTSKGRRSLSRSRRSKSKDTGLRSRMRRSSSRDRRSRSRNRRSRSRNIGSNSRELSSKIRDRRSISRDRRSRSRPRLRGRSLSRDRRSRSRDRRSRSLHKRRPVKRSRRHSGSSSSSSSSSRSRRSYSRGRRSKSRSPSVIAYKPRIELIDLEKYEENTGRREGFRQQGTFDGGLITTPGFTNQAPSSANPFHSGGSGFNPPPPGVKAQFDQPIHPQFATNQPPPAPFISSHTPPEIPSTFLPGQPSAPQPFNQAPPPFSASQSSGPILIQPTVQFPPVSQPNEFGGYQVNTGLEYKSNYPLYDTLPPLEPHFPQPQAPSPPIIRRQPPASRDFGGEGKWSSSINKSSNLIYPGANNGNTTSQKPPPKKSGVEEEMQNQKQTLEIQREQYLKKSAVLHKDLAQLKDQRSELLQDNLPETDRLLKENTKLQNEVNQRLKAIENVIEMLTGLIKKDHTEEEVRKFPTSSAPSKKEIRRNTPPPPAIRRPTEVDPRPQAVEKDHPASSRSDEHSSPKRKKTPPRPSNQNPSFRQTEVSSHKAAKTSPPPLVLPTYFRERSPEPMEPAQPATKEALPSIDVSPNQVNLVHYDPELHWCSLCNVFPKTAIDYLTHLHTSRHKQQIIALKLDSNPWHADEPAEPSPPFIKNAPVKRIPVRGVQFLVPSTGWYCRLCKTWIGDVHCASEHLKGRKHTTNYTEYIAQNPHWEVDWMSDRTKSYERSSENLSRLRDKEESEEIPTLNTQLETEKAKFSALSDTLLAVLAQQNKRPRHTSSSSSSSSSDSHEDSKKKSKRSKKKRSKRKKKKEQSPEKVSPAPAKVPVEKPAPVVQYRKKNNDESPSNDNMITDWMEDDKIDSSISINLKNRFKQKVSSNQVFEDRQQSDRNKQEDKTRREENKTKEVDMKHRDERSKEGNKTWGDRRDNRINKEDSREPYNKREFRGRTSRERDRPNRDSRKDDKFTKRSEAPKKKDVVVEDTTQIILAKVEKKKSPIRVFQRPGDPSDRDSPEPVVFQERRDKKHDKPQGKLWFPSNKDDEEEETPFEKQGGENVIGKKKVEIKKIAPFTMPKSKLPFIGRMPILKKKTIDFKSDDANKDPKSIAAEKTLFWPNIPSAIEGPDSDKGVKEPKILPKTPTINKSMAPEIPSPLLKTPVITVETKSKFSDDNLAEQDMEIANDDQDCIIGEDDLSKGNDELHPDFQDTLDLLFPESGSDDKNFAIKNRENTKEKLDWSELGSIYEKNKMAHVPGYDGQFERNVFLGDLTQRPPGYSAINDGTLLIGPVGPQLVPQGPHLGPPPGSHLGPPPGTHVGPPPGTHVGPPPGSHVVPPPGSHIGPPPGSHVVPPPGSHAVPPPGSHVVPPPGPHGHHVDPTGPLPNTHIPPPGHIGSLGPHVSPLLPTPGSHVGPPMGPPPGPPRGPPGPLGHPGPPRLPPGPPPGLPPMARQMGGPMGHPLYDDLIEEPMQKRKNAPSQRMRRHLQKKRAQEAKTIAEPSLPTETEEKKTRYEGMDHADLAMLGIDEDDSIIA